MIGVRELGDERAGVLVTGFGPFPGVTDNPTATIARAVNGRRVRGETVTGIVLPVSYARGPDLVLRTAALLRPRLVLGLGVAVGRKKPEVETIGRRKLSPKRVDVDGVSLDAAGVGPDELRTTLDAKALAAAIGAALSDDAGDYACNAWLWTVLRGLPGVPVGFVHVPASGLEPAKLLKGIAAILT